jgi:hypothetical protein
MRTLSLIFGVLLLLPGACSLIFVARIGLGAAWGLLFNGNDPYAILVWWVWGGSFVLTVLGVLLILGGRKSDGGGSR